MGVPADPAANNFHLHHLTHEESLNMPTTFASKSVRPARPLSLAIKPQNMRSIEGVPIETPTNVLSSLNFDSLMDGRTGLTPTNVLAGDDHHVLADARCNHPQLFVTTEKQFQTKSGQLQTKTCAPLRTNKRGWNFFEDQARQIVIFQSFDFEDR